MLLCLALLFHAWNTGFFGVEQIDFPLPKPLPLDPCLTSEVGLQGELLNLDPICSNDGTLVAVPTTRGVELLGNREGTLTRLWRWQPREETLQALSISGDGRWLMVATENKLLLFSNTSSVPRASYSFSENSEQLRLFMSEDGGTIALLRNERLYVFHGPTLELRWMTEAASGSSTGLAMADNGQTIIVWSDRVLAFAPDAALPLWMLPMSGRISAVVSPDGVYVAVVRHGTVQESSRLMLLSRLSNQPLWEYEVDGTDIEQLRFSNNSRYVAMIAGQYYLFECRQSLPVMQHSSSGNPGFAENHALLLGEEHIWALKPAENQAVSFRLPLSVAGHMVLLTPDGFWLYMIGEDRIVRAIRLPQTSG